jgi:hypothetical protein
MKKEEVVKQQIDIPSGIPVPGSIIQVQEIILGGGEQVEIEITKVIGIRLMNGKYNDDERRFQKICTLHTSMGILTHDLQTKKWWRVIERVGDNQIVEVYVFPL